MQMGVYCVTRKVFDPDSAVMGAQLLKQGVHGFRESWLQRELSAEELRMAHYKGRRELKDEIYLDTSEACTGNNSKFIELQPFLVWVPSGGPPVFLCSHTKCS